MTVRGAHPAEERFQGLLLRHRGRTGLTQRQLAERMGANRRSLQDWEGGLNLPSDERLRALIAALLEAGAFATGDEAAEAEALWAAVLLESPRMRTPFDPVWFAEIHAAWAKRQDQDTAGSASTSAPAPISARNAAPRRQDWGDAPQVAAFHGRARELAALQAFATEEYCRVVALVGMGGIGKTTLAARLADELAPSFELVYWRSLRNAPSLMEWLSGAIRFLSGQQQLLPGAESAALLLLLQLLREHRCLLVLDNFETLLDLNRRDSGYRTGYHGYGRLLHIVGTSRHQSCVVLTSRELPPDLEMLGAAVRKLELHGLGLAEGQALLGDKQLSGDAVAWATLVERYAGNGLALKIVGESIRQVFDGDIASFLNLEQSGSGIRLGGIRRLLDSQVDRLSEVEQDILRWLAIEREAVNLSRLRADMGPNVDLATILEALETLRRRSLVEPAERVSTFTLQSLVLEYVTDRLVEGVSAEIEIREPALLVRHALMQAQARDFVRRSQERLIGQAVLQQLVRSRGRPSAEECLLDLLENWRNRDSAEQGYGPGNAVNLLRLLRGDLRGLDLSHLSIRQAYLQEVDAQDSNLTAVHLTDTVLPGTFSNPMSVALSSDGRFLAIGTAAGEVCLWRVADRALLLAVHGHLGWIRSVALSGNGRLLASGGEDGTVRLWSVADVEGGDQTMLGVHASVVRPSSALVQGRASGRLLATLREHTGAVYDVALSEDGRLLASGGADGVTKLYEAPSGQLLATLQGHIGAVWSVALNQDGRLLASGGDDRNVKLWSVSAVRGGQQRMLGIQDSDSVRLLATLQGHAGAVWSVALSRDGRLLASGSADGTARVWDASSERLLATLPAGVDRSVALSGDGQVLASSSATDGRARLWEAESGRLLATLEGHTSRVHGVALSGDGQLLASGAMDGTARLWDAPSERLLATLQGHTGAVWSVAMSGDGRLVASGGADRAIRVWDAASGRLLTTVQGHWGAVHGVALSGDGRLLAGGSFDGNARLWEAESGRLLTTLQGHAGAVWSVAMSGDGRLVASGSIDGTARVWEALTGRLLTTLHGHGGPVWCVTLSEDGRLLASGSTDGTARVWDVQSGEPVAILQAHTGTISAVALSGDGCLVATGGMDRTARLWEANSGRLLTTVKAPAAVLSVALSRDGRLLGTGSSDGKVTLSGRHTGQLIATMEEHTGLVRGVALSWDGSRAASGSFDGTVRLWETSTGKCVRTLQPERPYERMDTTDLTGVTDAQRQSMIALGAIDRAANSLKS